MHCVRTCFGIVVVVSALLAFQAGATPIGVTQQTSPPSKRTLTFEEMVATPGSPSFKIAFSDYPSGPIELFDASATVEERLRSACTLNVTGSTVTLSKASLPSEACRELLKPLFNGAAVEIAVSKPQSSIYALLVYTPPESYAGAQKINALKFQTNGLADWSMVVIPVPVTRTQTRCYVHIDQWHALDCNADGTIDPGTARAAIEAALSQNQSLELILHVQDAKASAGAWRSFTLEREAPSPSRGPTPLPLATLTSRCDASVDGLDQTTGALYVICVDAIPEQSGAITRACSFKKDGTHECQTIGDVLHSGRDTIVFVWSAADTISTITFGGAPGFNSPIYSPALKVARRGAPSQDPSVIRSFGSRKPGTAQLQVISVEANKPTEEVFRMETTYTIEAVYRWALRLGIGATWAPWSREYGVLHGKNNEPYSGVLTGGNSGMVSTGLVAGLTYFCKDIQANSATITLGLGGRVGVVGQSSNSNVRVFDSLMVGPELVIGPDFSVGIFGGVVLDSRPKAGFEVGKVLPAGTNSIQTQPGIAPGFSIALNFTPGFLQNAGMIE